MIAPSPEPQASTVRIETPFGPLTVGEDAVLAFPDGILGLTSYKRWVLLASERADRFWLQSADERALTMPLIDPFTAFAGYTIDVPPATVQALGAAQADDLMVLAPVTLGRGDEEATANLRGPILINMNAQRGLQLVVDAGPWSVRERIPVEESVG